jgi:uncharacterized protein (DUF302 family)
MRRPMKYYFEKKLESVRFEDAVQKVTEALKEEGFGVLTEIDVSATMKKKLDVDFRPYRILGACSPHHAYRALSAEDKIGAMLPCNVIVQQVAGGVEVAAVDPIASMSAVENKDLEPVAMEVRQKLQAVISRL